MCSTQVTENVGETKVERCETENNKSSFLATFPQFVSCFQMNGPPPEFRVANSLRKPRRVEGLEGANWFCTDRRQNLVDLFDYGAHD